MKKKQLLYRKSHKYDSLRSPVIIVLTISMIYILADFTENWVVFKSFLKYGFTGNGLWFIFVCVFLIFTFLLFYVGSKRLHVDEDEAIYLDDELIYVQGKKKQRINVSEIYEIHIFVKEMSFVRIIKFKTKNPKNDIVFSENYAISLRRWIDPENLIKKGVEIYQILRKINPNIELTRFVPRKYRSNKKTLLEVYRDGKWIPKNINS